MPSSIQRTKGRAAAYKFDRGGTPADPGPFVGVVKNNVDPARMARLQVYIEQFSGGKEKGMRTVSYLPGFYGSTFVPGSPTGPGTFTTNQQSYGMWFTPPDLGVKVMCFFVEGDPNQGYYVGVIPDEGINHMIPAIGASRNYALSGQQDALLAGAPQLPVTEINTDNPSIVLDPRFFDSQKPVHSVLAGLMFQQGIIRDPVRGPITSNSQRESPSAVFGFSTPGRPIYQGGMTDLAVKQQLETDQIRPQDIAVIGRRGGHSMVLDDGDLEGRDNLVRIRTAKGHQITMSDDGDCFYIIHANGQTWIELGKQGTVDVFSTNSVNVRTQGTINLHADRDINMYAGGAINIKGRTIKIQADVNLDVMSDNAMTIYSKNSLGIRSDGALVLKSVKGGAWDAGSSLSLKAECIDLNGGGSPPPVRIPLQLKDFRLADTRFSPLQGWQSQPGTLSTIVTRAPTHEPYPYHNQGTANVTTVGPPPAAPLNSTAATALASVASSLPDGAINAASFVSQGAATIPVGTLVPSQVTGLLAQAAAVAGQASTVVSEAGVGKYAISPGQLESAGLLKPGTVQQFLSDPSQITSVLSSPSVWTGRAGVSGLGSFLSDPGLQDLVQQEIMSTGLNGLQQAGIVTGLESPAELAPFVQAAAKFGVNTAVDWAQGRAPANLVNTINGVARGAQYAVAFVDEKLPGAVGLGVELGGAVDTVQRGAVNRAVTEIIGNAKIPAPNFGGGLYESTPNSDLTYSGNDDIVLQRINQERRRRGLPALAAGGSTQT